MQRRRRERLSRIIARFGQLRRGTQPKKKPSTREGRRLCFQAKRGLELVADAEAPLVLVREGVAADPGVTEVKGDVAREGLAEGDADFMAGGVILVGSPGAETSTKGAVKGNAVGLIGTDREGDVSERSDVLDAITKGDIISAVTQVAADRGLGVDEEIGAAEVGGGGQFPAIEMAGDAVGGLLDVADFDIAGEEAGRTGSRESGGRAEGEETDVG